MICAIEELPRVEKVKVVLAMCLNEGQGVQEWEWQEPRPSGPKAESWTQALYSAPVLAGAACRHFLELLHFPGLSSTCFISFSRFKDVQWCPTHPENKKIQHLVLFSFFSFFFQNIQACSENTAKYQACASWPDGDSHELEARWGKLQCSQHACVLWFYLEAPWACFFFGSLLIKKNQIPSLWNIAHHIFYLWLVVWLVRWGDGQLVSLYCRPSTFMNISSRVYELNIKASFSQYSLLGTQFPHLHNHSLFYLSSPALLHLFLYSFL